MKDIWVLSVRTSLPNACERFGDMKTEFFAFECFEDAKAAFREKIQKMAFSENSMFNGKGQITHFSRYIDDVDDDFDDEDCLTKNKLSEIQEALIAVFSGVDTKLQIEAGDYTDWMIAVSVQPDSIDFYGDDDGPWNGYDPVLKTNMFSMEKEMDYYLYIDDRFGQDDATSELYIDLKKVTVE